MYMCVCVHIRCCTIRIYVVAPTTLHPKKHTSTLASKVRTPTGGWISAPGKEGAVLLNLGAVFSRGFDEEFLWKTTLFFYF